jgi:hypothetical protein
LCRERWGHDERGEEREREPEGRHQRTVIVPRIPPVGLPWTEQKKVYVPASVNVTGKLFGGDTGSPLPRKLGLPAEFTSWKPSAQTNVTVVPTGTSMLAGSKRLPPLATSLIVLACTGAGDGGGEVGPPPGSLPPEPLHAARTSAARATVAQRAY